MTDSQNNTVLAIDGGGTRCRFVLVQGAQRHAAESGPVNVSTDFNASIENLMGGVSHLANAANLQPEQLYDFPAFLGLAGVTGDETTGRLKAVLPFRNATYADDRPAALRGALGLKDGVIAHCGTGSFFAGQIGGIPRFSGGWGPVLGDEASAQWVGRRGLSCVLQVADGNVPASSLTERLLTYLGGTASIIRFATEANPAAFGALAPLVTEHAKDGDVIARDILQSAADIVATSLTQMGWAPPMKICLTGGIGPEYEAYLPTEMRACVTPALGAPLEGAIALAQDRQKEMAHGYS